MKALKEYLKEGTSQEYDYQGLVEDWIKEHPGEYGKKAMKELMSFGGGALNPGRIIKVLREAEK